MTADLRYQALIGTGGIGSGLVLKLDGNETLGREESRGARLLDRRDYAKLHIICHYIKKLLGPHFAVYPIGCVGRDAVGDTLRREMSGVGLDMRHVRVVPDRATLFAVCFLYPDGDGGNLSTIESASSAVSAHDIEQATVTIGRYGANGIVLAVPEAPLETRARLLALATDAGSLRVASFVTAELADVLRTGLLANVDLLALNIDEAAAVTGTDSARPPEAIAQAAADRLHTDYPHLRAVFTAGKHGSWCWDGSSLAHTPALRSEPVSTAGAGDAHLAGLIVALSTDASLPQANRFATLVSAMKLRSPDTINRAIDARSMLAQADDHTVALPAGLRERLADVADPDRENTDSKRIGTATTLPSSL